MFSKKENEKEKMNEKEVSESQAESAEQQLKESAVNDSEDSGQVVFLQEQLSRLTADFQNFKKRNEKDRLLWAERARADMLLPLLEVVDNFDRALEDAGKKDEEGFFKEWIKGFELIRKALQDYLVAQKVSPIEQNSVFDPNLHEAVMQVEVPDYRSGDIVEVMQKGYMHKGNVLRTAKVTVAK
jgi:molecular chaperone GrpE